MLTYSIKFRLLASLLLISFALFVSHAAFAAPDGASSTATVTTVVTVLGPSFTAPPPVGKDDVIVHVKDQRADIIAWNPAQGDHSELHLAILIDDGINLGPHLQELRHFVATQPNSASIGVFYASNGTTLTAAPFSSNHEMVAGKVRITLGPGSASTSVYLSLIDVMKKMQSLPGRREILLIGDGHDPLRGDLQDPDVDRVISSAQKTGIVIHTLYSNVGRRDRGLFRQGLAQDNLIKVSSGSGGQSFFQGLSTPVSYTPFLDQLDMVLHNQYLLTFATPPSAKKKGDFRSLKITTEQRNVAITAQSDVFVPGM
ncbi:MAG TPA: hypothetical protein VHX49_05410 [Candidatus Acidoferrales bacterium]|jgi:hypothetical protein|nr:hypothetical protein [Candidatus Acidoferrales bacterium]